MTSSAVVLGPGGPVGTAWLAGLAAGLRQAGALGAFGSYGQRALLAAEAGMDLLLCSAQDPSEGQAVVTALAGALDRGQLDPATFNAAVDRVTALRNGLQ